MAEHAFKSLKMGCFSINRRMINQLIEQDILTPENPTEEKEEVDPDEVVTKIAQIPKFFDGMIVLKAEFDFARDGITYLGIHKDFEECHPAQVPPEYLLHITWNDDGEITQMEWKRAG